MSALHFTPLRVARVDADGDEARVVTFEPAPGFDFEPGQYLTLRRGELRRSYSICVAPAAGVLRIGVRRVAGGAFSGWLHRELAPGDVLDALPPQGRFGAALARRPRHALMVAGGSGITPIVSLLQALLGGDAAARATLVYANRSLASTMFLDALHDLKDRHLGRFAWLPVFSREPGIDSPLAAGRVDGARLATVLRLFGAPDEAFVCGPHAMNDEVEAALVALGVGADRVHVERFGVPPSAADATLHAHRPGDADGARVTVVRDGTAREVVFGGADDSILAAATRAGLDLPWSCRSGVCATCRAKVLHGTVRMDRNFALEPDDLAAGFVLTCQAHPLSERVTVSFDERR